MISKPMQKFAAFGELLAVGDIDMAKVTDEKDKLLKYRKDEVGVLADSFNKISISTAKQAHEMQAIADGDLSTEVTVRSENDVIGKALAVLTKKFHSLAVSISSSADEVDSSARQVAISSTSLSQGATEQASSIEELTASWRRSLPRPFRMHRAHVMQANWQKRSDWARRQAATR